MEYIVGENLDHLLKAVLSKLQRAETLTVVQSLVLVYAQLIHSQAGLLSCFGVGHFLEF